MTQAIAKYAAKKMLSKEMDKYKKKDVTSYDPYYEMIDHPTKPGKQKKVKKQIPAYIPTHDAEILAKARKTAYRMDCALFNFAGIRFGWSSVIGIVPALGDGLDALLAFNLILHMRKIECGLSNLLLLRMLINLALDFAVGLVPFVGDIADAAYKCNSRNVRLLEQRLDEAYRPKGTSNTDKYGHSLPPATVYEDFSDEEQERLPPAYDGHEDIRQPTRAYSGRRERQPDVEMGFAREDTRRSHRDERPSRSGTKKSTRR